MQPPPITLFPLLIRGAEHKHQVERGESFGKQSLLPCLNIPERKWAQEEEARHSRRTLWSYRLPVLSDYTTSAFSGDRMFALIVARWQILITRGWTIMCSCTGSRSAVPAQLQALGAPFWMAGCWNTPGCGKTDEKKKNRFQIKSNVIINIKKVIRCNYVSLVFENINNDRQHFHMMWKTKLTRKHADHHFSNEMYNMKPGDALKTFMQHKGSVTEVLVPRLSFHTHWNQLSYSLVCFVNGSVQAESLRQRGNVSLLSLQILPRTEGAQSSPEFSVHSLFLLRSSPVARVFLTEHVCVCMCVWSLGKRR